MNQTLRDIEIILVDDESPDRVPEMCDAWATRDERIRVVHKKNEGLGMACNSGLDVASGKYVAFCDSDDWVDAEMYETMYNAAEKRQTQAVYTGLKRIDTAGNITPMMHPSTELICKGREEVDKMMLDIIASEPSDPVERRIAMSAKVVLYLREHLEKYHIRFESERKIISEDLFFNLDVLTRAESVTVLPNSFYYYFCNDQSLTAKVRTDRFEKNLIMRDVFLSRYTFRKMPAEFTTRVNRMFIGYNRSDTKQICQATTLSKAEKNKLLREVCGHPIWRELNNTYPVNKMPFMHRLFFKFTLNKNLFMLKLMANANKEMITKYNALLIKRMAMGGAKISLIPSYLWDKLWAPVWKRAMKHCGKGVYLRPMSSDIKGLENLSIGDYTSIPKGSTFYCTGAPLTIGNKVIFGPKPTIITGDHRIDIVGRCIIDVLGPDKLPENDLPVVIENDVWCGANVTILKGVTIGRGSVIAAGAVVTKSCPPYSIIGGVPAKVIKMRFTQEQIVEHEKLLNNA